MEKELIIQKVKTAGVVGAGGAGFPTHVKLNASAEIVIANGAECEPLLRVDQQIMAHYPERVIKGLELAMDSTGAGEGVIGIKGKYRKAIEELEKEIKKSFRKLRIHILGDYYPAGDEQDLTYEVTGKIVPEGGIPIMVGAVVDNVGTLYNIANAVEDEPVISRCLTIGGAVQNPVTVQARIGTSFRELLELAGGASVSRYALIEGGPMMGEVVREDDVVKKTTAGILALPEDLKVVYKKLRTDRAEARNGKSTCDQCFECTIVCYRNLLGHALYPHKIMRTLFLDPQSYKDEPLLTQSFLCTQCGLCDFFACPLDLSPRKVLRWVRTSLAARGIKNPHQRKELMTHVEREFRRVSVKKLKARLGLDKLDHPAPLKSEEFVPAVARILLKQHIGVPAEPVIKKGEKVQEGQVIGKVPEGKMGADVHASIGGTVTEVNEKYIEITK